MPLPRELLGQLLERRDLTQAEAAELLDAADAARNCRRPMAGALLAALRAKGVVAEELRGFAAAMRAPGAPARTSRPDCAPSISSAPAAMPRAASTFPPARRC